MRLWSVSPQRDVMQFILGEMRINSQPLKCTYFFVLHSVLWYRTKLNTINNSLNRYNQQADCTNSLENKPCNTAFNICGAECVFIVCVYRTHFPHISLTSSTRTHMHWTQSFQRDLYCVMDYITTTNCWDRSTDICLCLLGCEIMHSAVTQEMQRLLDLPTNRIGKSRITYQFRP
jgi:hypothetical protein